MLASQLLVLALASFATARKIPDNLKTFYNAHKKEKTCANKLSIAYNSGQAKSDTVYCKDKASGAVFLKDIKKGGYADMDIDCDGASVQQGACSNDGTGQGITAFQDQVKKFGINDLDSQIHTFVVLGNDNSASEGNGGTPFDPAQSANIKPLSVVAVVCNNQLLYGVWGDVNGGILTGESSVALAQMCFPSEGLDANHGHEGHDVLYLAFEGEEAVVGKAADWKAKSSKEFEKSLAAVGDKLVKKIGGAAGKSRVVRGRL
ncbi:fungal chitosanase [Polyplosphaeria fusca]|uniref:Endo-chitosanase n=1 Tax=Polyplosphaeria fusca TaxID=682080 RepID=A0A9P4UWI5_9PLEO|nr:fungal chitosanase [Polyplosphaeria fusca]